MATTEIILIALGLAMDAFAVSLTAATAGHLDDKRAIFRLAFHFGLFQFLMPVIGWFFGANLVKYVLAIDHWLAFALLVFVGGHMIHASFYGETSFNRDPSKGWKLVVLSFATSIDALAVGLTLGVLHIHIWFPALIIGIITGILSVIAIRAGERLSGRFGKKMELVGGILLVFIGLKILLMDLFN